MRIQFWCNPHVRRCALKLESLVDVSEIVLLKVESALLTSICSHMVFSLLERCSSFAAANRKPSEIARIKKMNVKSRTYHSRNTPEGVGQHFPNKPSVAHFAFEEQDSDEEEVGDDGGDVAEDEFEPELGTGTELGPELGVAVLFREKPFRVAIQYNSWVLLRPGSSLGLETPKARVHAAFGSLIAWLAIT